MTSTTIKLPDGVEKSATVILFCSHMVNTQGGLEVEYVEQLTRREKEKEEEEEEIVVVVTSASY